ncbi:hypothetical protein [Nonomuraea rosea]|uniref:hypothetical protein n=1 Tax=Nonomuraea rosea TaxID=638574 RepID=UPI0031E59DC7
MTLQLQTGRRRLVLSEGVLIGLLGGLAGAAGAAVLLAALASVVLATVARRLPLAVVLARE